jgi:hypothetical protein
MNDREKTPPLTDEQLIRIFKAMRTPREEKVVPPGKKIISHPLGELEITLEHLAESTKVTLKSESDYWKGSLIHCLWKEYSIGVMVIMKGKEVSFTIKQRLYYFPLVAKIVIKVEPDIFKKAYEEEIFRKSYEEAIIRPTIEELGEWAEREGLTREGLTYLLE